MNKRFRFKATCPRCDYSNELETDNLFPQAICCHCLVDKLEIISLDLSQIVDSAKTP